MSFKLKSTNVNPYQAAYDKLRYTPYFNQDDWDTAVAKGADDLNSYIGNISAYDKLPSLEFLETNYSWSDMDFDQKNLLMYSQLYADNTEKKNYSLVTGYDDAGKEIKQDFELTEKEYYETVLKDWAEYNKEQLRLQKIEDAKYNAGFWESIWYGIKSGGAMVGELGLGALNAVENVVNFLDGVVAAGGAFFDALIDPNAQPIMLATAEGFREALSDDNMVELFGFTLSEATEDWRNDLMQWEMSDTYLMNSDGTRTAFGKIAGEVMYSIGKMIPGIALGIATGGAATAAGVSAKSVAAVSSAVSQGFFYTSIFEENLQERFKDDNFNSVATMNIVLEGSLKTGLEFLIEKSLGKFFGVTAGDALRGVTGKGKALKGVVKLLADVGQEGLEETLQDFSGWCVSNTLSLMNEEFKTDFSAENLIDAAISGAVSSLVLGGFAGIKNSIRVNKFAKQLAKSNINYSKLDAKDKRAFRKSIYAFTEAKSKLNEVSSLKSFGLTGLVKGYDDVKSEIDSTTPEGKKALMQLNTQMYDAYKFIMGMYGSIGLERAKSAETLLNELNKMSEKNSKREVQSYITEQGNKSVKVTESSNAQFLEQSKFVSKVWEEQLKSLIKDDTKRAEIKTDLGEAEKQVPKKRGRPKGSKNKKTTETVNENEVSVSEEPTETTEKSSDEVEQIDEKTNSEIEAFFDKTNAKMEYSINKSEPTSVEAEKMLETAKELSSLYGKELVIWDNTEIVEVNDKIFAPKQAVVNLSTKQLIKAGAERTIVNKLTKKLPGKIMKNVAKHFTEFYRDLKKGDDVDEKSVWAILYDRAFYWYVLNRADKSVIDVIKVLDNLAAIVSKESASSEMYKEYNLALRRIRKSMAPALALYFCNNPYISFENVTIFTPEQIAYIQEHRYNAIMSERLISLDHDSEEFKRYKNVIINRINALNVTNTTKQNYLDRLNQGPLQIKAVLYALDKYTHDNYFGKYDDYYFKAGEDVKTARLNTFLTVYNITYDDLLQGRLKNNITLHTSMLMDLGSDYNIDDVHNWLSERFEFFTGGDYTLQFSNEINRKRNLTEEDKIKIRTRKAYEDKEYIKAFHDQGGTSQNYIKYLNDKYNADDPFGFLTPHDLLDVVEDKGTVDEYINLRIAMYLFGYSSEEETFGKIDDGSSSVEVVELNKYQSGLTKNYFNTRLDLDLSYIDTTVLNIEVMSVFRDLLKDVDTFSEAYTTVNDIITNPEIHLTNDTLNDIRREYNMINGTTVYKYLQNYLLSNTAFEYGLVINNDGTYGVRKFTSATEFLNDDLQKLLNDYYDNYANNKIDAVDTLVSKFKNAINKYTKIIHVIDTDTGEVLNGGDALNYLSENDVELNLNSIVFSDISINSFINNKKLIGNLKDVKVTISFNSDVYGYYDVSQNTIHISSELLNTPIEFLNTLLHEFQHAVQYYNYLAGGGNTSITYTSELYKDITEHVPEVIVYDDDGDISKLATITRIEHYIYLTLFGEQVSHGDYLENVNIESTLFVENGGNPYIITAWGTKHYWYGDNKMQSAKLSKSAIEQDVKPVKKKRLTSAELKPSAERGADYQKRVNEALELVKKNKADKKKTFKKDLAQFKLPKDIVNSIISGSYTKKDDPHWKDATTAILRYQRRRTSEKRSKEVKEGRAGAGEARQLFKKEAEGTNLMYWYNNFEGYVPQIDPAVKAFVLSATDFNKLDKELVKQIKEAKLTIYTVNDFLRDRFIDEKGINDYTFNELKKAFFKNSPFTKFAQIKTFVEQDVVMTGYCARLALEEIGKSKLANSNLLDKGWKLKDFVSLNDTPSNLSKLKDGSFISDEKLRKRYLKAYINAYDRLTQADILTEKGKILKDEVLTFEDAKADIFLGLIRHFNGSLEDLRYIADNAKAQLTNTLRYNKDFTYIAKKGKGGQQTLSLNYVSSNDKDGSETELGDMIADERSNLEDVDSEGHYDAINSLAIQYYTSQYYDGKINKTELWNILQDVKSRLLGMSEEQLLNKHALINVLVNTGLSFEEAFDQEFDKLIRATFDDTVIEIKIPRGNVYKRFYNMVNSLSKYLNKKIFDKFIPEEFKKYFNTKATYRFNVGSLNDLTNEQIAELLPKLKEIGSKVRAYISGQKKAADTAEKQSKKNAKNKRKKETDNDTDESKRRYKFYVDDETAIHTDMPMPNILKEILTTSFYNERQSKVQYAYYQDKKYLQTNLDTFLDENSEILELLTDKDVLEILEFFEKGNVLNRDYVPYDAIRLYLLGYFIDQAEHKYRFHLNPIVLERIHVLKDGISSTSAQTLAAVRSVMRLIKPEEKFIKKMLSAYGIDMEGEPEVATLVRAIRNANDVTFVDGKNLTQDRLEAFTLALKDVEQSKKNLYAKALAKYKQRKKLMAEDMRKIKGKIKRKNLLKVIEIIDNADITKEDAKQILKKSNVTKEELKALRDKRRLTKDSMLKIKSLLGDDLYNYMVKKNDIKINKDGTINRTKGHLKQFVENIDAYLFASRNYANDMFNKILKFQKAMMLTAPATVVRGKLSNLVIGGFDYTNKKGERKHIGGLNDLSDIIGNAFGKMLGKRKGETEVEQYNFAKVKVSKETMKFIKEWMVDTDLLALVGDGLTKYDVYSKNATSGKVEDQLTDMIIKSVMNKLYGKNTYTHETINKVTNFIFGLHSDDRFIRTKTLRLVGKMIEADKIDISKGMTTTVMNVIAEAYTEAAYEYMHKSNFISDWIAGLKHKHPKAHFCLNLVQPFLSNGWNWFVDSLQMNPVALAANIRKLTKLDEYVTKLDEARRKGDKYVPSSRFAEMLIKRDIGKGVIGTALMILGLALSHFDVITVDREDEKLKLQIGKTYIDFSNLYGATPLLVGAELANPKEGDFWTVLESAFNQQFDDSALTSIMNMFRYNDTPADYFLSLPTTIVSGFIPNIYKQVIKCTNNHSVKYSKGLLGDLEYLAVQAIPFIEYAMPKQINPYTGEWEEKYSMPYIHQLATLIGSPVSFKTYNKSDVELAFDDVNLNKSMLKGEYKDIGKVDKIILNEFYGKLNQETVSEFIKNKVKYKVKIDDDEYAELYYKDMDDEQRKSVLSSITTKNANSAKIYAWTQSGHKYYCSAEKRRELIRLGITKNIYVGNKGFVK